MAIYPLNSENAIIYLAAEKALSSKIFMKRDEIEKFYSPFIENSGILISKMKFIYQAISENPYYTPEIDEFITEYGTDIESNLNKLEHIERLYSSHELEIFIDVFDINVIRLLSVSEALYDGFYSTMSYDYNLHLIFSILNNYSNMNKMNKNQENETELSRLLKLIDTLRVIEVLTFSGRKTAKSGDFQSWMSIRSYVFSLLIKSLGDARKKAIKISNQHFKEIQKYEVELENLEKQYFNPIE